jgi:hypothetical protein
MAKINDIHSVVVPAQSPNLTAHTYSEVYGGTSGCVININGVVIDVANSSNLSIWVKSVSGGTGCWLFGEFKDVTQGSPNVD